MARKNRHLCFIIRFWARNLQTMYKAQTNVEFFCAVDQTEFMRIFYCQGITATWSASSFRPEKFESVTDDRVAGILRGWYGVEACSTWWPLTLICCHSGSLILVQCPGYLFDPGSQHISFVFIPYMRKAIHVKYVRTRGARLEASKILYPFKEGLCKTSQYYRQLYDPDGPCTQSLLQTLTRWGSAPSLQEYSDLASFLPCFICWPIRRFWLS